MAVSLRISRVAPGTPPGLPQDAARLAISTETRLDGAAAANGPSAEQRRAARIAAEFEARTRAPSDSAEVEAVTALVAKAGLPVTELDCRVGYCRISFVPLDGGADSPPFSKLVNTRGDGWLQQRFARVDYVRPFAEEPAARLYCNPWTR